jgi:excinuclease UvrABC nuclease subunit
MSKHLTRHDFKDWLTPNSYDNDFAELPNKPGVYLFVTGTLLIPYRKEPALSVLYVGMSRNLKSRCENSHPVWIEIHAKLDEQRPATADYRFAKIYFKLCNSDLRAVERQLIEQFQPPYNFTRRLACV